jgi:SAM-dependent methyltransferase
MTNLCRYLIIILLMPVAISESVKSQEFDFSPPIRDPDVGYVPTSYEVVDAMLTMAKVTKDDVVYDLGSGDGRLVISAARDYGARGVGIDVTPRRILEANENARRVGVVDKVTFIQGDMFVEDISEATVVTLYLLDELNLRLRPKLLRELKPGSRIVSNTFKMGDWEPEAIEIIDDKFIYLWIVP